jgi:hypothetical protein
MRNFLVLLALISSTSIFAQDLFEAAKKGNVASIKRLISDGADVNAKDKTGKAPLLYAAMYKRTDAAKILISNGAEITDKTFLVAQGNSAYYLSSLFTADNGVWDFLDFNKQDVAVAEEIARSIIKEGSEIKWSTELETFIGDRIYEFVIYGRADKESNKAERKYLAGEAFATASEKVQVREEFKTIAEKVNQKIYDKFLKDLGSAYGDFFNEYMLLTDKSDLEGDHENWVKDSYLYDWKPILPKSKPETIALEDRFKVRQDALKDLIALDQRITHAKTAKDIMEITILVQDIAALGFEDAQFKSTLEGTNVLLDVAAGRIDNVEEKVLVELDAKAVLCNYVSIPTDFPNDFVTLKALEKMDKDLQNNGDVFSVNTLKYIAREDVLNVMATSKLDPSVLGFVKIFSEVLDVEGSTYKNPRYYTDKKFEEVKSSLREIKGVVKK